MAASGNGTRPPTAWRAICVAIVAGAVGWALGAWLGARRSRAPAEPDDRLERAVTTAREATLVAERLSAETAALERKNREQADQIRQLVEELAVERREADAWRAHTDARAARSGGLVEGADVAVRSVRVADVDATLRMAVLEAGREQGLRNGMVFVVLRDRTPVGRATVVDARANLAGAVIHDTPHGQYPRAGDRAVLVRSAGP